MSDPHSQLEQFITRSLREQPPLKAPRTLAQQVLEKIEQRQSQVWWRRNFLHWPLAARAAFIAACIGLVTLTFTTAPANLASIHSAPVSEALSSASGWMRALAAFQDSIASLLRILPSQWITTGLLCAAALYAVLFGVGAFAFRSLSTQR